MEPTRQAGMAVGAHLVGGLDASDAETVMRTPCRIRGHLGSQSNSRFSGYFAYGATPFQIDNERIEAAALAISGVGEQLGRWRIKHPEIPPRSRRSALHRHHLVACELPISKFAGWRA